MYLPICDVPGNTFGNVLDNSFALHQIGSIREFASSQISSLFKIVHIFSNFFPKLFELLRTFSEPPKLFPNLFPTFSNFFNTLRFFPMLDRRSSWRSKTTGTCRNLQEFARINKRQSENINEYHRESGINRNRQEGHHENASVTLRNEKYGEFIRLFSL